MRYLFVGGPRHGQVLALPGEHDVWKVPVIPTVARMVRDGDMCDGLLGPSVTYYRKQIGFQTHIQPCYVAADVGNDWETEAMAREAVFYAWMRGDLLPKAD